MPLAIIMMMLEIIIFRVRRRRVRLRVRLRGGGRLSPTKLDLKRDKDFGALEMELRRWVGCYRSHGYDAEIYSAMVVIDIEN